MDTLLPGISAERVPTSRLTVNVLSVPGRTGRPVLFVHGNVSSSLFWQPVMLALPEDYRPLATDLHRSGDTDPEPVDATRGLRDYACPVPDLRWAPAWREDEVTSAPGARHTGQHEPGT